MLAAASAVSEFIQGKPLKDYQENLVVDPENWTGALALESPWRGVVRHDTDQESSH